MPQTKKQQKRRKHKKWLKRHFGPKDREMFKAVRQRAKNRM